MTTQTWQTRLSNFRRNQQQQRADRSTGQKILCLKANRRFTTVLRNACYLQIRPLYEPNESSRLHNLLFCDLSNKIHIHSACSQPMYVMLNSAQGLNRNVRAVMFLPCTLHVLLTSLQWLNQPKHTTCRVQTYRHTTQMITFPFAACLQLQ